MGRPKPKMDDNTILAMRSQGKHIKEISENLGISTATLTRRIAELTYQEGVLTKYRELQGFQLTDLQFRILRQITPEKIEKASLLELVKAFAILYTLEKQIRIEPCLKLGGRLVDYLSEIERMEKEEKRHLSA